VYCLAVDTASTDGVDHNFRKSSLDLPAPLAKVAP